MSGYLRGTETMFRHHGYTGTESHFGVGGPWDGATLDGVAWQWQDISHQADAQISREATSIETSDGGNHTLPWSNKQLARLIDIGVWWCRTTGNPASLLTSPNGAGIGYHQQFQQWNPDAHDCPGAVRIRQLTKIVIPGIAARLNPTNRHQEADDMTPAECATVVRAELARATPAIAREAARQAVSDEAAFKVRLSTKTGPTLVSVPRALEILIRALAR